MNRTLGWIERRLTRSNAIVALVAIALLTAAACAMLRQVRLDHAYERFLPHDDPEMARYAAFRARFGSDNDHLFIALEHAPSVFRNDFLRRADSLLMALRQVPDVRSVIGPTRLDEPRITPLGVFQVPWLRCDHDSTLAADSARIWNDPLMRDAFFAPDARAMLLIMHTEPGLSKARSDALLHAVNACIAGSGIAPVRMGGRVHGQFWFLKKMRDQLAFFLPLSVVVLALGLFLAFRTSWGVLVPLLTVGLSVLWQVALMTALGRPLTILTILLPTILFVVGTSDMVHILERYIGLLRAGHDRVRALAITYHQVGLATTLTSVTTAIGFGTLMLSALEPIREFGLFTAIGVLLALLLSFTLLPAVLLLVPPPPAAGRAEQDTFWHRFLQGLFHGVLRHRRRIPMAFAVVAVTCAAALPRLHADDHLLGDWADHDPQKQEYRWFEETFGGVRPFEMEVSVLDSGTIWDHHHLQAIAQVQDHVASTLGVRAVLSPVTVVRALNKATHGGDPAHFELPADPDATERLVRTARAQPGHTPITALVSADGRRARITGRMVDHGSRHHLELSARTEAFLRVSAPPGIAFHPTGMAHLIDRGNAALGRSLLRGLVAAFLLVALTMALAFRDLRMTLVALLPNMLPLLIVAGGMAMAGMPLQVSTAMIFTIAFGIAVDDTIHLLARLRIELAAGRPLAWALKHTMLSVGKALVVTTLLLLAGFAPLLASALGTAHHMGLLISLTLVVAGITDLVLLPVLVLCWGARR